MVAHLVAHGLPALGADSSATAIRLCHDRGAPAIQRDVFAALPGEGDWDTALLADGNIGIGGDPLRLLRRTRGLLRPAGRLLVETEPDGGLWRGQARLRDHQGSTGSWFPWATVDPEALRRLASAAGFRVGASWARHDRWFTEVRPGTDRGRVSPH
ncbi:hypothetical protein M8542_39820 [Amycolatopsis sp. OK19-0408]|uniref:Uncharacterized protein n=1 Tax=Amycolatopsis iheyensis TaxID=2945988 RepID=A0A9X2SQ73_9PSEU|nr:hypothetical protein [Amycolatopsis iheyensis]